MEELPSGSNGCNILVYCFRFVCLVAKDHESRSNALAARCQVVAYFLPKLAIAPVKRGGFGNFLGAKTRKQMVYLSEVVHSVSVAYSRSYGY